MKKSEIKELVRGAIDTKDMCRLSFKYDYNYFFYFPLKVSERLFLSAIDDDFNIDGFSIRRFSDLTDVHFYNDKRDEILKAEGVLDSVSVPEVEVTDWHSVFASLQELGKNIIVEHESLDCDEGEFYIGRIEKVLKNKVIFGHFDADCIWEDEPCEILFSQITSVTFGSRYIEVLSKYV